MSLGCVSRLESGSAGSAVAVQRQPSELPMRCAHAAVSTFDNALCVLHRYTVRQEDAAGCRSWQRKIGRLFTRGDVQPFKENGMSKLSTNKKLSPGKRDLLPAEQGMVCYTLTLQQLPCTCLSRVSNQSRAELGHLATSIPLRHSPKPFKLASSRVSSKPRKHTPSACKLS